MKSNLVTHNDTLMHKTTNPTETERINFLEYSIRRMGIHEPLCESRRPEFVKKHSWSAPTVTKPHACDCWLSEPFGSIGLSADYS